jgi:tRNA(fMet)-specific endonuclease VapC
MLDTNAASHVIKGAFPAIREKLARVPMENVCVSAITAAELLFGVARRPDAPGLETAVGEFLLRLDVLAWDSAAARAYAGLRSRLERAGRPLGALDTLIAAHALAADAVLVTSDKAFRNVKELKLEDWTKG